MTISRFAPSPTGDLHIGGVRTALFAWAFAKKNHGKFILRIEDTDQKRSTQQSVEIILEGMRWLGLDYDIGPVFQTERIQRYQELLSQLLKHNQAYYCTCSKQRLDNLREQQWSNKQKPKYDGHCRHKNRIKTDDAVIRFANPTNGAVTFDDLVRGRIVVENQELDDLIIARVDGSPTYNFCVVVDDMDLQISHVIRGDDHINNTPRQVNIFNAFGATTPQFAHVPMILGVDGARLSKRHGALSLLHYRDEGYLPEALLNYLVRLGWSYGEQEIFSLDEIVNLFTLQDVNKAPSTFNPEKLLWLNQQHIARAKPKNLVAPLSKILQSLGVDFSQGVDLIELIKVQQPRSKTLLEMAQTSKYFYQDFDNYDDKAIKNLKDLAPLQALLTKYSKLRDWRQEEIHGIIKQVTSELDTKMGKVAQPLRAAVTGGSASPSIDITLQLLGKVTVLTRIQRAIDFIKDSKYN